VFDEEPIISISNCPLFPRAAVRCLSDFGALSCYSLFSVLMFSFLPFFLYLAIQFSFPANYPPSLLETLPERDLYPVALTLQVPIRVL
jgi:hypothetical protein